MVLQLGTRTKLSSEYAKELGQVFLARLVCLDLGARRHQVFVYIVFPMIRPAVIATMLFSFSLSFDEFIRTIFVIGFDRTMPIQFWTMIVEELAPELPAMAVMIIVVSSVTAMLGFALMGRNNSRS